MRPAPPTGARGGPTLCPGRKVGLVGTFGLESDRNGSTEVPIDRVSGWIVDCSGSWTPER